MTFHFYRITSLGCMQTSSAQFHHKHTLLSLRSKLIIPGISIMKRRLKELNQSNNQNEGEIPSSSGAFNGLEGLADHEVLALGHLDEEAGDLPAKDHTDTSL